MNHHLLLLAFCQGMFLTNNATFIAINALVGLAMAPVGWMATLPVTGYVVGGALSAPLVARTQRRYGRRASFQLGLVIAALACGVCAFAVHAHLFWLLVAGTVLAGYYSANASLYRFAGPELVEPSYKEKAISLVLAGGVIGAFLGPNLASFTREWMPVKFMGSYIALIGVAAVALVAISFIRFPVHVAPAPGAATGRSFTELARQPQFVVALVAASLGYGVMNLLMSVTPIAMQQCQLPFSAAALVLEVHVLGMFVPSFFTGQLIARFGTLRIMSAGAVLNFACVAVALSGVDLSQFVVALLLLGVGWNFLYTAASALLTETYRPEEKNRAQGYMDTCVFATMAVTSFSAGALVTTQGWTWLNWGSLVPMGATAAALLWLAVQQRRPPQPS